MSDDETGPPPGDEGFPDPERLFYSPREDRRHDETVAEWRLRIAADRPTTREVQLQAARIIEAFQQASNGDDAALARVVDMLTTADPRQLVGATASLASAYVEVLERLTRYVNPAAFQELAGEVGPEPGWILRAHIEKLTQRMLGDQ